MTGANGLVVLNAQKDATFYKKIQKENSEIDFVHLKESLI